MTDYFINKQCDEALQGLAEGNMDGLVTIYNKLGRRIFMLAFSILRDKEAAEDIMQDTFIKIATEARTYNKNSNAVAFILTVTRNLSLNLLAKRRREAKNESSIDSFDDIVDHSNGLSSASIASIPELSLLDDDERQIVVMKLDAGMKHKDIGAVLSISEDASQKRYRRALEKLKSYYKKEGK